MGPIGSSETWVITNICCVWHPRRAKTSFTPLRKPKITRLPLVDRWRAVMPLCSGQAVQEDSLDCFTPNVKVLCSLKTSIFTSIHGVTPRKTWIFSNTSVRTPISHLWLPVRQMSLLLSCAIHSSLWAPLNRSLSSSHSSGLSKGFLSHPCLPTLLTGTCYSNSSVCYLFRVITFETVNYLHVQCIPWTREFVRIVFCLT